MTSLLKLPDPDPGYPKYLAWATALVFLFLGFMIFGPQLELRYDSDREFSEKVLRDSSELKQEFEFVYDIDAISNPARGRRDFGEHAWTKNDRGGFFTFKVRGYKSLKDQRMGTTRFRIHFSRSSAGPKVVRIEKNAPWLDYGEEPSLTQSQPIQSSTAQRP